MYDKNYEGKNFMKLACSLYWLRDATRISLVLKMAVLNEVKSASFVFTSDEIMVTCYLDDIWMFWKHKSKMKTLKK